MFCFYYNNPDWNKGIGNNKVLIGIVFVNCYYLVLFSDPQYCIENHLLIRAFMRSLPAWFRFAQCCRRYRDTKEANPHLANAIKYSTSFLVVIFSTLNVIYSGKYLCLIVGKIIILLQLLKKLSKLISQSKNIS